MSFDGMDREVVQTNADAFTSSSENGFYNFIGNTENQANRIFENLDQFKTRDDGSYDDAVKEYKKVLRLRRIKDFYILNQIEDRTNGLDNVKIRMER